MKPVTIEEVMKVYHNGLSIFSDHPDAILFTAQYYYNLGIEDSQKTYEEQGLEE